MEKECEWLPQWILLKDKFTRRQDETMMCSSFFEKFFCSMCEIKLIDVHHEIQKKNRTKVYTKCLNLSNQFNLLYLKIFLKTIEYTIDYRWTNYLYTI